MIQPRTFQITGYRQIIDLPKGYWAFIRTSWNDAWAGIIVSLETGLEISYSAGTIQKTDLNEKDRFFWKRIVTIENDNLVYVLEEKNGQRWLHAEFRFINFSARISKDEDIPEIIDIISTLKKGPCETCTSDYRSRFRFRAMAKLAGYKNERVEEISKFYQQ